MRHYVESALRESQKALNDFIQNDRALSQLTLAGAALAQCMKERKKAYSCGNGGSMCDAMHFAEELSGRFRKDRPALPGIAISDAAHLSCTSNDFGYDAVFARFIEAHGNSGDFLLAISTSGNSKNVLNAAKIAREKGMQVLALTGKEECELAKHCDWLVACPGSNGFSDRVQELHIKCIHILIELVERTLYPENYAAAR